MSSEVLLAVGLVLGVGVGVFVANSLNSSKPDSSEKQGQKGKDKTPVHGTKGPHFDAIPGAFESSTPPSATPVPTPELKPKKAKKKASKGKSPGSSLLSVKDDAESPTPRATPARETGPPPADVTQSEDSEPVRPPTQRRPLAERLLPKPRKTGVDDMFEAGQSQYPTLSRVMRVTQPAGAQPGASSGASLSDNMSSSTSDHPETEEHEDGSTGQDDDDGWNIVPVRGSGSGVASTFKSSSSQPKPKAPEGLTKKQRQNAAKRTAVKVAKASEEVHRQQILASTQKRARDARIAEAYKPQKGLSGGMSASVDAAGKKIWD